MIPKKIHYCWFGNNEKSEVIKHCIASWKQYCPDYEIIEWNESNYDLSKSEYMKEAYNCKKWAFVTDYARFDILNSQGGIYLDTDVELFSSFDDLLKYDAFFSFESGRYIASGLCFGAIKNHKSVENCLKAYDNKHFLINGKEDLTPCPEINTNSLMMVYPALVRNGKSQIIDNTFFLGCDSYLDRLKHHGTASWVIGHSKNHTFKKGKIKAFLRMPSHFYWIEKYLGKRILKYYTIAVYDLIEMGPLYYLKRLRKK